LGIPAAALIVFVGLSCFVLFAFLLSAVSHLFAPTIQDRQHLVRAAWRGAINRRRTIGRTSHRATTPGLVALLGVALMAIFLGNLSSAIVWLAYKLGAKLVHGPTPEEAPAYLLWVGGVIALLYLIDAVRYAVHPVANWRTPSDLPRVPLDPRHVSWTNRVLFFRCVYLYKRWRLVAQFSVIGGAVLLGLGASYFTAEQSSAPKGWGEDDVRAMLWVAGFALGTMVSFALDRMLVRGMAAIHGAVVAADCLESESESFHARRSRIADPFGQRRKQTVRAADALARTARRIDRAGGDHPVASILYACAARLRAQLRQVSSFSTTFPPETRRTLEIALVVIAGPRNPHTYASLGDEVDAFDAAGQPRAQLREGGDRKGLLTRAVETTEQYFRLTGAAWGIFLIVVAIYLLVVGRLDLADL
jgi:hypothetical protein